MARSISFVIEGDVDTRITITELDGGALQFDIEVLDTSGSIGDLRGIFFDLNGYTVTDSNLSISGADVNNTATGEEAISRVVRDVNLNGDVVNDAGNFDVGVEFGTSGLSQDDIRSTSFTLSGDGPLTLDMLNFADFGLRYMSHPV